MSNRFKRVSFSLYLDPKNSIPDSFTFNTMIDWKKKSKELANDSDANAGAELHNIIHVHKDIYMSGLFLHRLKPELAKSTAAALSATTINSDTLLNILKVHGIEPESTTNAAGGNIDTEALSTNIAKVVEETIAYKLSNIQSDAANNQELTQLFDERFKLLQQQLEQPQDVANLELIAAIGEKLDTLASNNYSSEAITALLDERFEQLQQKIAEQVSIPSVEAMPTSQHDEQLLAMINEKLDALQQADSGQTTASAAGLDTQALGQEIAASVNDQLDTQKEIVELQQLVGKQNTLINQLLQLVKSQGVSVQGGASGASGQADTEERLARVQSVKKKGVF